MNKCILSTPVVATTQVMFSSCSISHKDDISFFFFFFQLCLQRMEFLRPAIPSCCCENARSLTYCTTRELLDYGPMQSLMSPWPSAAMTGTCVSDQVKDRDGNPLWSLRWWQFWGRDSRTMWLTPQLCDNRGNNNPSGFKSPEDSWRGWLNQENKLSKSHLDVSFRLWELKYFGRQMIYMCFKRKCIKEK